MLLKRRRCSVLYNHWDVFLRYCFKILGLSNCVVCLQESSEQGWKKDRVLKRSEFTHIRFYIEINQKWSDFILVLFFYLTCHFFCTYDRFYQVYTSFRFNHGGFCSLFYQTHVNDVSFHVFLLHFSWVYLLFLITFMTFHADFHFFPSFYSFFVQFFYICGLFSFFYFLFLFFVLFAVCPVSFHGCVTLSLFAGRASWSWTHWNCRTTTTSADSSESEFHLRTHRGQKTNQTHIYQ